MKKDLPLEWEYFLGEPYNALDDYRQGMRLWTISREGLAQGGISINNNWYTVDPAVLDEFNAVESRIVPQAALNVKLPIQHVGARLAAAFAASMGMRLPNTSHWKEALLEYSTPDLVLWKNQFQSEFSRELIAELRYGSFYAENGVEESGVVERSNDFLEPIDTFSEGKFKHLGGNVAEYLYDPESDAFFVTGGSALSAVAETWQEPQKVRSRMESTAYSDVGLRLAIDAPARSPLDQYLRILENY